MVDTTANEVLTTADGTPLKVSLRRALRREKIRSLLLIAPLFLFILITFLFPIADMLYRGIDNEIMPRILPRTLEAIESWDPSGEGLPDEAVFAAMAQDVKQGAKEKTIGKIGRRLNYEVPGMSSLFRKSQRTMKQIKEPPYKEAMIKMDKKWGNLTTWRLIKREAGKYTWSYYLAGLDLRFNEKSQIVAQPKNRRIYVKLFGRTLWLSTVITLFCLVLGYPIAFLLATLPLRISNLLMILVLLPFWTSLLVRTTSWIALLQQQGVINDLLVWLNLLADDSRLRMIHNQIGTMVAMTHILLPFMVLPLYSVMKTIPPSYMRAARSLGANPFTAFVRVYMPNTVPGIGAGCILIFILSIGYYITPALVGGTDGTFISNFIAYHISTSLNWGLAAALGVYLLALILALYVLYDKLVGIDNMKLG